MSQEFVRNMAVENRRRLVAALMGHFEREVLPLFPANERQQRLRGYRTRVQAHVGQYHDFVLDVISSIPEGIVLNENAMELLQEVHARLAVLRASG